MELEGAKFSKSQRGNPKLSVGGHLYVFKYRWKNGKETWRCFRRDCSGAVNLLGRDVESVTLTKQHCHPPDWGRVKALEAMVQMKEKMATDKNSLPSEIIRDVRGSLDCEAVASLPRTESLTKTLVRQQRMDQPAAPQSMADLALLPKQYTEMMDGKRWLLKDTGHSNPRRQLIFATSDGLRMLRDSQYFIADGTFRIAPKMALQLYTVHARTSQNSFLPCLYSIMKKKDTGSYVELFSTLREELEAIKTCDRVGPQKISTDYEAAVIEATKKVFPQTEHAGCLFHLSQALWRCLQTAGLQVEYGRKENVDLRLDFHSIIGLAFVPAKDIPGGFDELSSAVDDRLDPVLLHMEENYVRGRRIGKKSRPPLFPPPLWSCYERTIAGEPRTTNPAEGYHHKLNTFVRRKHPSIFALLEHLQLLEADMQALRLKTELGHSPPRKRRKYRMLDERIYRVVEMYDERKSHGEILRYLRAVGSLFAGTMFHDGSADTTACESDPDECFPASSPIETNPACTSDGRQVRTTTSGSFLFVPATVLWQKEKCKELRIPFVSSSGRRGRRGYAFNHDTPPSRFRRVKGDGACFFRSLSFIITGTEDHHQAIRNAICDNIEGLSAGDMVTNEGGVDYVRRTNMRHQGTWATLDEIFAAARVLNAPVFVWATFGTSGNVWHRHKAGPADKAGPEDKAGPAVYLDNSSGNHFDVVTSIVSK